jgi:hypothetical protein
MQVTLSFHLETETDPVSESFFPSLLEFRVVYTVLKSNYSETQIFYLRSKRNYWIHRQFLFFVTDNSYGNYLMKGFRPQEFSLVRYNAMKSHWNSADVSGEPIFIVEE